MRKFNPKQMWTCNPPDEIPTVGLFDEWLAKQTGYTFALAHADDGVIWGRFDGGKWVWSSGIVATSPKLRAATLQQLRLFSASGELLLWRSGPDFAGRMIQDDVGVQIESFDEDQLVWGSPDGESKNGFQLMREGAQGLLHAPPDEIAKQGKLTTRNYIGYDDDGCVFVKASRLTWKEDKQDG